MCAEIQSDSPSPAGWSATDRLGSSALEGIIGIEWRQSWGEEVRGGEPLTEQRRIQLQPVQLWCCPLPIPTLRLHIQEQFNHPLS